MTPRWLTNDEQDLWRRWLRISALLPVALNRDLQADAGLSFSDFEVLVRLTEEPAARLRVTELARGLQWERSRVSHHVARMQQRGLVTREDCADDRRGAFVVVTEQGRAAMERAAPGHVESVRRQFFDVLDAREVTELSRMTEKLLGALEPEAGPETTGANPRAQR